VLGAKLKDADLTEKMAFFEAYGALAGAAGIPPLEKILVPKGGLLARKEDPETYKVPPANVIMAVGDLVRILSSMPVSQM